MKYLFEETDVQNHPFECFYYHSDSSIFPVSPHWHYHMELLLIMEGQLEIHVENAIYTLHAGEVILFYPRTVHSIYRIDDNPASYAVIQLDLNRMTVTSNYSPKLRSIYKCAKGRNMPIVVPKGPANDMQLAPIFHRCIYEMNTQSYGYDVIIRAELYKLLVMVLRFWQDRGFVMDDEVFAEDDSYDIYNITQYIDSHMGRDLKVADIANSCGMSYSYFAKKFQAAYGKSCKEYIEDMRVYKAEELLVFTDFDLSYISQVTGFSDCSHMIRSFKSHKGVTPKQFRMQHAYDPKQSHTISWAEHLTRLS